eukprot:2981192-Amphidinium_carterae.1
MILVEFVAGSNFIVFNFGLRGLCHTSISQCIYFLGMQTMHALVMRFQPRTKLTEYFRSKVPPIQLTAH